MLISTLNTLGLIASLASVYAIPNGAVRPHKRSCKAVVPSAPVAHQPSDGYWSRPGQAVTGSHLGLPAPSATVVHTIEVTSVRGAAALPTDEAVIAPLAPEPTPSPPGIHAIEVHTVVEPVIPPPAPEVAPPSPVVHAAAVPTDVPVVAPVPATDGVPPTSVKPDAAPPPPAAPGAPEAKQAPAPPPPPPPPAKIEQPTSGASQSPVGLSVNYQSHCNAASFGSKMSWYYSWNLETWPGMEGLEFVPMIKDRQMAEAFTPEQLGKAQYALSLNEPDNAGQNGGAALPEAEAVRLHQLWTAKAPAGVQLGSIAVTNGGRDYFRTWKAACAGSCRYDFIPIHFYGFTSADFIAYAKSYADEGKPLWVTEIACRAYVPQGDTFVIKVCSAEETRKMMKESIGWMRGEGASLVHRWTWFGAWSVGVHKEGDSPGFNLLDPTGNANELGKLYASL